MLCSWRIILKERLTLGSICQKENMMQDWSDYLSQLRNRLATIHYEGLIMLNDAQIRSLKPLEKAKKYSDGGGLYLYVAKTGSKFWRMAYRFNNKESPQLW